MFWTPGKKEMKDNKKVIIKRGIYICTYNQDNIGGGFTSVEELETSKNMKLHGWREDSQKAADAARKDMLADQTKWFGKNSICKDLNKLANVDCFEVKELFKLLIKINFASVEEILSAGNIIRHY